MRRRSRSARWLAMCGFVFVYVVVLVVQISVSAAQTEEPTTAALHFYEEYMGMGVALKPLGERWFTLRFKEVIGALDKGNSDPLAKPTESNPILPWKSWDASWRNKLKAETLQASAGRAQVLVTFAIDEQGRPIARLVHFEKVGGAWRVDDVTDPPR